MPTRVPISYIECDIPAGLTVGRLAPQRARSRPPRRLAAHAAPAAVRSAGPPLEHRRSAG